MPLTAYDETFALRPVRPEDADTLLAWRNHPLVRQSMYTSHVIASEDHLKWLDKVLSDDRYAWFVLENFGQPAGVVGFTRTELQDDRVQWTFHLDPDSRGRGAGAQLARLALQQAFDHMDIRKVEGEVLADNEKSLRFHRSVGFREDGMRRAHVLKDGLWHDVHLFSMLREEWAARQSRSGKVASPSHDAEDVPERRLRLLFTGGGGSGTQALQEQWGARYDLFFADANPHGFPPSIPHERRLIVPFANDPAFADRLKGVCSQHEIDVVIPGVDEELPVLARQVETGSWPHVLVPGAGFVDQMLDKLVCARAIAGAGLSAPRTTTLLQAEEIGFPLIAKPRQGRGSRGVMRLSGPEQVAAYLALHGGEPEDCVAQELIDGAEYTVFVAADGGDSPHAVVPVRAFEKRGVTIRAQTDANPEIVRYAQAFQAHFRPSGCYNIQCMLTPDGRVFPFEVNPRISTTFVLAVATGFDPIPMAMGRGSDSMFVPDHHLKLQRSWFTHIDELMSGKTKETGSNQ